MLSRYKQSALRIAHGLNGLLLIAVVVLLLSHLLMVWALTNGVRHQQRLLVPPVITEPLSLSNSTPGPRYLQRMAEYFVFLKLNVTPETVGRQYGQLAEYLAPSDYHRVQPALVREAQAIKKQGIASSFAIRTIQIMPPHGVQLSGTLQKSVGERPLAPEQATYQVAMGFEHGTLTLKQITRVDHE